MSQIAVFSCLLPAFVDVFHDDYLWKLKPVGATFEPSQQKIWFSVDFSVI